MSGLLVEDELWERVEPLLPAPEPRRFRHPGRKPLDNRAVLMGILFVLRTGRPWNDLPREVGRGSGDACWVRLHEWHKLGVWTALHEVLLAKLRYADQIDWSRAAADSMTLRALRGDKPGQPPTDRGGKGTKDHLLTDAGGIPLAAHARRSQAQTRRRVGPARRGTRPRRGWVPLGRVERTSAWSKGPSPPAPALRAHRLHARSRRLERRHVHGLLPLFVNKL